MSGKKIKMELSAARTLLVGDPHLHSTYSDGKLDPPDLLRLCAARCLDFVGVSDHNTTAGALAAREVWADGRPGPRPFLAQEVSTEERLHLLVYGLEEPLGAVRFAALPALLDRVDREGGAAVLAHPWTILDRPRAQGLAGELLAAGLLHGLEIASAALFYEEFGRWRQTVLWGRELGGGQHLSLLAGTDWHDHGQGLCPGLGRTIFWGSAGDDAEFVAAIRAGRTAAWLHWPSLIEHGLIGRLEREAVGLWATPWEGLIGSPELLAEIREERGRLQAMLDREDEEPRRRLGGMLLANGSYASVVGLLGKS